MLRACETDVAEGDAASGLRPDGAVGDQHVPAGVGDHFPRGAAEQGEEPRFGASVHAQFLDHIVAPLRFVVGISPHVFHFEDKAVRVADFPIQGQTHHDGHRGAGLDVVALILGLHATARNRPLQLVAHEREYEVDSALAVRAQELAKPFVAHVDVDVAFLPGHHLQQAAEAIHAALQFQRHSAGLDDGPPCV